MLFDPTAIAKMAIAGSGQYLAQSAYFKAARFSASFNCKYLFEVEDCTVNEAWTVDLWTKADSVTLFDEVTYGATK